MTPPQRAPRPKSAPFRVREDVLTALDAELEEAQRTEPTLTRSALADRVMRLGLEQHRRARGTPPPV